MHQIKNIVKIKNCPSFVDFTPATDLPDFARYNLFYGWNGSGKTTFSRILRSFESGQVYRDDPMKPAEFKFRLDDKSSIGSDNISSFKNIRVFNRDFILESVFCAEGAAKPIFYLGKESKEDEEKIIKAEKEQIALKITSEKDNESYSQAVKNKERLFKARAQEIKTALTTALNDNYRNYNINSLKTRLANATQEFTKLSETRVAEIQKAITQTVRETISPIFVPDLDISNISNEINAIRKKTVISKIIQRFQEDAEIAKWVETGLEIHRTKDLKKCAFCDQEIQPSRMNDLAAHFNDEYRQIISSIRRLKLTCNSLRITTDFPTPFFYEELEQEYLKSRNSAEKAITLFNDTLNRLVQALDEKEENVFLELEPITIPAFDSNHFKEINRIINRHNEKTHNFTTQIQKEKEALEFHFIADLLSLYSEKEFLAYESASNNSKRLLEGKERELTQLKANLLSHQIAVERINNDLKDFLGRDDLQMKGVDTGGYQITRNGEVADNLSEGERTAIAIVYFLTKLGESNFDKANGVVVIDDPISSLDSNATFQAFSFIRKSIEGAGQIFILTHHFDFFKRVRNWFMHENKPIHRSSFFMFCCLSQNCKRNTSILKLDELLQKYDSEYHYLFNIIYNAARDTGGSFMELYPIPNVARKFLEGFLAFRVPIAELDNSYKKLERLTKAGEIKKRRVLDFLAPHSHARYESGIQDMDMTILGETRSVLNDLLDIVKAEDTDHFNFLVESITPVSGQVGTNSNHL